ncbi:metalloregulator ArsR/SmtB family transcription factor [Paenibacillus septentrionalis]|uniref:Metalloregulator ArsR/SmtB family transcription factor n=1 Tax=Paenibacillus septentrionalis TaxID=429342 RepID=A0ABW1V0D4_9BACL
MQLSKVVTYHKALADPTRIKMLILLADGELNGLMMADKLGVSTATITHHAAKLRDANLIQERRDKNTIYFALNNESIKSYATATIDLIDKGVSSLENGDNTKEKNERLKRSVLKNFFTADGRLRHLPAQLKKRVIVLEHLVSMLEKGRPYSEKEINHYIQEFHEDYATIRRELIMHQFMFREDEIYELNPSELWTKWEALS